MKLFKWYYFPSTGWITPDRRVARKVARAHNLKFRTTKGLPREMAEKS